MTKVYADYLPRNVNQYVPAMEFAADIINGVTIVNLGAPKAADPNGILSAASATTTAQTYTSADWATTFDGSSTSLTTTAGQIDAKYGRCITAVGTAGSDHVITIKGKDYLGQVINENLTLNGTATLYGEKTFKYVDTVIAAVGSSGDTFDLGWDDRLGLPYNTQQLLSWSEDNVDKQLGKYQIAVDIIDAVSADTVFGVSGEAGFVTRMDTITTVALGSGDAILTAEIGGTAVAGLSVTVASSGSAIGVLDGDAVTNDHGATSRLAANAVIEVVSDGGSASTGTVDGRITVQSSALFTAPVATDPGTATTGDPRGTVQPYTACDGSVEYEARISCNTSNLHGVSHFGG